MTRLFAGTPFDRPPKCERCGELETECVCPPATRSRLPPGKQTAHITIEKRKKGKKVTVVSGLSADTNDFPALLTHLKTACGAGGTSDSDSLEIQGEHKDRVQDLLLKLGYRVK